jgi:hypothetical protein
MRLPAEPSKVNILPGPFASPPSPEGIKVSPAVRNLVDSQVQALLQSSSAYHSLAPAQKHEIEQNMAKIAAYTAALVQDDWAKSRQLGQTPVVLSEISFPAAVNEPPAPPGARARAPLARAAEEQTPSSDEFSPRAASQVARITQQTLNAIAFPTFVADLIKGTFRAIVDSSMEQMKAFGELLANVAKTVDQFMADNISDNMARDNLVARYPGHFRIDAGENQARVVVRDGADELQKPNFQGDLGLAEDVALDDDAAEQFLVPAARRQLAQNRLQLLSTMMLMGVNRIVVTSGRIRAQMGFRIDATDTGRVETASQFDSYNEIRASYGGGLLGSIFGGPSGSMKHTLTYVSSTKKESQDELNVEANLTGEVDLKFKSDYFPLERFAPPPVVNRIQQNTANPGANPPVSQGGAAPAPAAAPAAG